MKTDQTPNTQSDPFDEIAEARASEPAVIYARDRQTKFGLIDLQEFVHFDITNEDDLYAAQQIELLHDAIDRNNMALVFGDPSALERTPEAKLQGFLLSKFEAFSRAVLTPMAFDDETMEALHELAEVHGIKFDDSDVGDEKPAQHDYPQVGDWWEKHGEYLYVSKITRNHNSGKRILRLQPLHENQSWNWTECTANKLMSHARLAMCRGWYIERGDQFEDYITDNVYTVMSQNTSPGDTYQCVTNGDTSDERTFPESELRKMRRLPRIKTDHVVDSNKKVQPAPKLNQRQPERGETVWLPFEFRGDDGGDSLPWEVKEDGNKMMRCLGRPNRWHVGENLPMASLPPVRVGDLYDWVENPTSAGPFTITEIDLSADNQLQIVWKEGGIQITGRLSLQDIQNTELYRFVARAATQEASE